MPLLSQDHARGHLAAKLEFECASEAAFEIPMASPVGSWIRMASEIGVSHCITLQHPHRPAE